jgi:putative transposase
VGQPRGTQRYTTVVRADEDALTQAIIALATQCGRYGYRRIKSLLDEAGWDAREARMRAGRRRSRG